MNLFTFRSDPVWFSLLSVPTSIIIYSLMWLALFVEFGWLIKSFLILIFILTIWLIIRLAVRRVVFNKENVIVYFWFLKEFVINYSEIQRLEEIQQGMFFFSYTVIKTKTKMRGKQKFPFYCPPHKKSELQSFLAERKLRIRTD